MNMFRLNNTLLGLKIKGTCINHEEHRHLAFYDVRLLPGATVSKLESRAREIALQLRSKTIPIVKTLSQEGLVRLQVATRDADTLPTFDLLKNTILPNDYILPFVLGENDEGKRVIVDMAKNPHLLVAGGTGSGKSVFLHTLIANAVSLNKSGRRKVELYLIDPKRVEFSIYEDKRVEGIVQKVARDFDSVVTTLEFIRDQMEARYDVMLARGIKSVEESPDLFPQILVIIDEVNDLIIQDNALPLGRRGELQRLITQITQKARAAGIYMVAATQHPSREVIKGVIKTNFPARVACRVPSKIASQVVLDAVGAENLLGRGDAILKDSRTDSERFQVAFTDPREVLEFVKEQKKCLN